MQVLSACVNMWSLALNFMPVAVDVNRELKIRKSAMENYEQNENNGTNEQQPPKYDPAGETKQKLVFFVIAIVALLALKFLGS